MSKQYTIYRHLERDIDMCISSHHNPLTTNFQVFPFRVETAGIYTALILTP